MTQDEVRVSAEILKTMFNITINLPDPNSTDTHEHCERIVFIARSMFTHVKPLPDHPENLPNHAINIVSNMPSNCLKHLMWTMPSSVSRKLAQDFETKRPSKRFRIQFKVRIWTSIFIGCINLFTDLTGAEGMCMCCSLQWFWSQNDLQLVWIDLHCTFPSSGYIPIILGQRITIQTTLKSFYLSFIYIMLLLLTRFLWVIKQVDSKTIFCLLVKHIIFMC